MTAYIITPEQHAQIVDALSCRSSLPKNSVAQIALDIASETLKAMKPVEVEAYLVYDPAACSEDLFFDGELGDVEGKTVSPLYAKEQQ